MSISNKTKYKNNIQLSARAVGDSEQGKTLVDDDKLNDYLTRTHVLIKKMPSVKSHGHLNATSNSTNSNSSNSSRSSSSSSNNNNNNNNNKNNSNNATSSIKRRLQNAGRSGVRRPVLNNSSNSSVAKNGCVKRKLLSSSNDSDGGGIVTSGGDEQFEQTNRICKIKRVFKNNSSFEIKKCYTKRRRISNKEISFCATTARPNGVTPADNADVDADAETGSVLRLTNGGDGTASLFKTGELEISLINRNATNSGLVSDDGGSPIGKMPNEFTEFAGDVATTTDVDSSDDRDYKEHLSSDGLTLDGQYLGIRPAVKFKCYKCEQTNFKNISVLKVHVEGCSGEKKPPSSSPFSSDYCSKSGDSVGGLNGRTGANCRASATIRKERRNNVTVGGFSAAVRGGEKNRTNLRITRRVYLCSACMTYYQNWDLYLHMKNVHDKQICLYCLSLFNLPIDLWSHLSNYHNVLINKYDAVDDLREALKDSFFLSCCTCNHLFSQDDDFVHHKCSEMPVDRNSYHHHHRRHHHHPKCPSLSGQSKTDTDGTTDDNSAGDVTSTDKTDGDNDGNDGRKLLVDNQSDLEENDYDISGVASFCRVALGTNNNRLSSSSNTSSSAVPNKGNGSSKLKTLSSSSGVSCTFAGANNVNVKTASVLPAEAATSRDGSHHVEKRSRTEQANSGEPSPVNQLEVAGKNVRSEESSDRLLQETGVATNSDRNSVGAEKLNVKTAIGDSVNERSTEKADLDGDATVASGDAFEKDDDCRVKSDDDDGESDDESKDVLTMALTLDDDVEALSLLTVLKECVRTSCANCLYCNNATNIATNAKQLALHLLQKHRYKPTKNSTWRDIVRKLRAGLSDLDTVYVNTESFDSTDNVCHVPFQRLFACFQCFYTSNLPKELYLHKRKVHQKNLFLCSMCECSFGSYSELFCHLCPGVGARNLYYRLQYRCCLCGIGNLPSAFRLMIHLRKVHRTCDVCLEEVDSRTTLNSHLGKHKTNHLCYKCGIAYASKTDINKHLFWKHGTESVSCKKCLQKKWPFIYHVCSPQMVNACEECNMSFKKPIALTVHKRFHTNDFRHACEVCGERFVSRKLTDKHRDKIHNSVKEIPESVDNASCGGGGGGGDDDDADNNDVINEENSSAEKIDNLVDNLPPLMLSSESDDSEDEEKSRNKNTDRNVINRVGKSPVVSNSSSGMNNNGNLRAANGNDDNDVGDSGEGAIKSNLSERTNSVANAEEENIWSGLKICDDALEKKEQRTQASDDPIPPVPLPEVEVNMDYFYLDHDYCLPNSLVPAGNCSTGDDKNDVNNKTSDNGDDAKKPDAKAKPLPTINNGDSSATMKNPKKSSSLRKNVSDSSSSSSSSSEDSDSSSSCSSNCSCPRSSSSSSSSSGTESSCSDKQKCHRRHRRKLKSKRDSGTNNSSDMQTTAEQPKEEEEEEEENRLLVNESDLYTELSSSDEEFYEKIPLILQREFIKSGIEEKQPGENKRNNGQEDNSGHNLISQATVAAAAATPAKSLSPKKKKSKNKRNKSSKVKHNRKNNNTIDNNSNSELTSSNNNWRVVNDNSEHRSTTPADRRSSPLFTCNTMDDSNNDAVLYNHFSNDSLTDGTTTIAASFKTPSTAEQRRNEAVANKTQRDNTNARQSKRKRVKNKFYGYSTSDEESTTTSVGVVDKSNRPTNKAKKLSVSSRSANVAPTTPLQSKPFAASLSSPSSSSSQQLKLKLPTPSSSASGKSGVASAGGYSKLIVPKQTSSGLRILPPSRPAAVAASSTVKAPYNTDGDDDDDDDDDDDEDDDSSDSANERKPPTPAIRFHSSKGNVLPTPSTNRILGGPAGIQSSHPNVAGSGSSVGVKNDNLYCYCQCPYDEVSEMIACDGPNCKIEWFHFECVGIMVPPKGKWFCPSCRKGNKAKW